MQTTKPILTITGSDSTGGAGVQADIKTISALGGYAVSAITSITVQNTLGIQEFYDLPVSIVSSQIEAIVNDVQPNVVKIGMIRNVGVLLTIVDTLSKYHPRWIVFDPVVRSAQGEALISEEVMAQIRHRLLPMCSLVILRRADEQYIFGNEDDAATERTVRLLLDDADSILHGQRNALSSAIAYYLSTGSANLEEAIRKARQYVKEQATLSGVLQGRSAELYQQFLSLLTVHLRERSDVAFYADLLNVTPRYLAQVTRRISGLSPKTVIDERLSSSIAQSLLCSSHTIQEIAIAYGFSSQAHLTRFFKKQEGLSPSQYRQSNYGKQTNS